MLPNVYEADLYVLQLNSRIFWHADDTELALTRTDIVMALQFPTRYKQDTI